LASFGLQAYYIIMEAFVGKWKMEKSEGFDDVMKCLGVGFINRKLGNTMKPNFVVESLGDGRYRMKSESTVKTTEFICRLGEEFTEITPDGREVRSIITIENGVMKHVQKGDGKVTYIDREIEGNTMKTTVKVDDFVCVRIYTKFE
uniref:FABP domain-containing protein n=1 Tax=Rodentolepis nana TaxID=102285 RepID=A0A0R3TWQ4_RODNA